jgi:hypothetical protein
MSWQVDWEVIEGARGRRPGDASNRVWQGETVRFNLYLDDGDPHEIMMLAEEPRNWEIGPSLSITDSTTVTVEHARSRPLTIVYRFQYSGEKRLHFLGQSPERPMAAMSRTRGPRSGRSAGPLFPRVDLHMHFEVVAEPSRGESVATTTGADGDSARRRESEIEEGRRTARRARETEDSAVRADRAERESRMRARRDRRGISRPGILPITIHGEDEMRSWEEGRFLEYARDLRSAIAVTPALDLNGHDWRSSDGNTYTGYWTSRFADGDVQFYFRTAHMHGPGLGRGGRAIDDEEAARVRRETEQTYAPDTWIVGRFSLFGSHKALFRAGEFAREVDWARLSAIFEVTGDVMDAFDIVIFIASGGIGSMLAGIRRAARALLNAGRRLTAGTARRVAADAGRYTALHADDAARQLMTHADDAVATERGLTRGARGLGDDVPATRAGADTARSPDTAVPTTHAGVPEDAAASVHSPVSSGEVADSAAAAPEARGTADTAGTGSPASRGTGTAIVPYATAGTGTHLAEIAATGLTSTQISSLQRLLGLRFGAMPSSSYMDAWRAARAEFRAQEAELMALAGTMSTRDLAGRYRSLFNNVRQSFFRRLAADPIAVRHFATAGIVLRPDGSSPRILMDTLQGRRWVTLDVDHIEELGRNPLNSLNPHNLMFAFERQNRTLHNLIISMDPFQPAARLTAGRGVSRAGRSRYGPAAGEAFTTDGRRVRGGPLLPDPDAPPSALPDGARQSIDQAFQAFDREGTPWSH